MTLSAQLGPRHRQDAPARDLLISADSHVMEDPALWLERLPIAIREQAPHFPPRAVGDFQGHPGGWDPRERIKEMSVDGVSAEVLYPTLGLSLYSMTDAALQEACFRVYNDWMIEYCSAAPSRLVGVAMISAYDINHAVAELERCRRNGLRGALIWQVPPAGHSFRSDYYDRFWAASQDLQMPVSFHILTGFGWSKEGFASRSWQESVRGAVLGEVIEAADNVFDLTLYGALERFPGLRIVLVESEIGWLPFVLDKMDQKAAKVAKAGKDVSLVRRPTEYFHRQIFATFFNDPVGGRLLGPWGVDNCMWSNDFPHPNSTWPNSQQVVARDLGHLDPDSRANLTWKTVAGLYNLDVSTLP